VGTNSDFIADVQLPTSSTSYELRFIYSSSTQAFDFDFDDVFVGPSPGSSYGGFVGDWTAYTPTLAGFTSPTSISCYYRRVGDSIEVQGRFVNGTPNATTVGIGLPTGMTIASTSKIPSGLTVVGTYARGITNATSTIFSVIAQAGATSVNIGLWSVGAVSRGPLTAETGTGFSAGGETHSFEFKVPILGFSTSMVLSSETDTRIVAFTSNTAAQIANATFATITWTASKDTHGCWTGSAYVVKVPGYYLITGAVNYDENPNNAGIRQVNVAVNGVSITGENKPAVNGFGTSMLPFAAGRYCVVGDSITVNGYQNSGAVKNLIAGTSLSITMLSGPAQVAASEKITAKYTNVASTSLSSTLSAIPFATKKWDSHGIWNGSTATMPRAGYLRAKIHLCSSSAVLGTTQLFDAYVYKNGAQADELVRILGNGSSGNFGIAGDAKIQVSAGDTIQFYVRWQGAAATLFNSDVLNWLELDLE
jgi:hypothetical protein